ncbi:MAG: hypothetical protein MUO22_04455 [Sedimentisphaerales bacterium]|jgi:hypothetical protein|nr:hypothetical protein [Sedimentisphaerales bacterium]
MERKRQLTKRQLGVIDEIFSAELEERAILEKYKISRNVYNKWLADERFKAEIARRVTSARLQSEALIARYSLVAAARLVQLIESKRQETSRRACLDIISLPNTRAKRGGRDGKIQKGDLKSVEQGKSLPPQTASRLLAALAEEKVRGKNK